MPPDADFQLKRLEAENQRLRRAVEELSILNEVAIAVTSTSGLDEIVDLIVQKCVKHLRVEQGAVLLLDKNEANSPLRTMVRKVQSDFAGIPLRLGDQITGWMLKNQQPLVINDLTADSRFRLPPGAAETVMSLLCVPLRLKGSMIGVLSVFNKIGKEGFSESDQRLLTIIAAQSAQVIENARLYQEEQALVQIEAELKTAREIQQKLLPKGPPEIPGYQLVARSEAARRVGGDYFDFLRRDANRVGLCLADVSGKGISASLLMAYVQATIRSQTLSESSVAERLAHSNQLLYESTDSDKFVTAFYGELDASNHTLRYTNAGHNPPLLFAPDGAVQQLDQGGPVLGVLPSFTFDEGVVELEPGALLVIFTDGYSEAMNLRFEEFGEERLEAIAAEHRQDSPQGLLERINAEVAEFCGDAPQTDDMTIMIVKREA